MVVQLARRDVVAVNHGDLVFDKAAAQRLDVTAIAVTFKLQLIARIHVGHIHLAVGRVHRHVKQGVTHPRMTLGPVRRGGHGINLEDVVVGQVEVNLTVPVGAVLIAPVFAVVLHHHTGVRRFYATGIGGWAGFARNSAGGAKQAVVMRRNRGLVT